MVTSPRVQHEIDEAYQQGIADLAEKVLGLIFQTDGEVTIAELSDFLEAELYRDLDAEELANV